MMSSVVIKAVHRVGNFSLWQISCYSPYLDYGYSSTYSLYLCYIRFIFQSSTICMSPNTLQTLLGHLDNLPIKLDHLDNKPIIDLYAAVRTK